jgi:hypothetical protein
VFNVPVQGTTAFPNLDIFAQAGANAALVKSTMATVSNGTLTISFASITQNPIISATRHRTAFGCIDDMARGSKSAFCRATGASFDLVSHWLSANGRMRVDLLVRICRPFGISPLRFLTERVSWTILDATRQILHQRNSRVRSSNAASLCSTGERHGAGSAQCQKQRRDDEMQFLLAAH